MLLVFVGNNSLTLSLALDPSALEYFPFGVDVFADSVLDVFLVDTLELRAVGPAIGAMTVFFAT